LVVLRRLQLDASAEAGPRDDEAAVGWGMI
jgi:hypothetical protein